MISFVFFFDIQGFVCEACFKLLEEKERDHTQQASDSTDSTSFITPKGPVKRSVTKGGSKPTPTKSPASKKSCNTSLRTPVFKPQFTSTPIRLDFTDVTDASDTSNENLAAKFGIESALKHKKYYTAFNKLINYSPAAARQFNRLVHNKIAEEVKTYVRKSKDYPKFNSIDDLHGFEWNDIHQDAQDKMPTYYSALKGAMHCMEWRSKKLTKHPVKLAKSR